MKSKIFKIFGVLILASIVLSSCERYYYQRRDRDDHEYHHHYRHDHDHEHRDDD